MDNYLLVKTLHILAAVVVTGTGAGIAFFMLMAYRTKNVHYIYMTAKTVIIADWVFTAPAVALQLLTGFVLINQLHFSYESVWFSHVMAVYAFIGICWLPVVYIQYKLRRQAELSLKEGRLNQCFKRLMRIWIVLGIFAFAAILVMYWLMLFKPFSLS